MGGIGDLKGDFKSLVIYLMNDKCVIVLRNVSSSFYVFFLFFKNTRYDVSKKNYLR
jgi:hypothetical protein